MNDVFKKNPLPGPGSARVETDTLSDALMEEWYETESEEHFAPRRKSSWRSVWIVFFLFLAIAVFGAGVVYWIIEGKALPIGSPYAESEEALEVSLESSETELDSGDTVYLTLMYTNAGKSHLTDVSAAIIYPDNFIFLESEPSLPENFDKNYWRLPAIPGNGSGKIDITGQLLGVKGEVKKFEASLMYKPTNFNSTFKASAAREVLIQRSVLAVEITGPDNLLPGQDVRYAVSILNIAAEPLNDVRVRLTYPEEFALTEQLQDTVEKVWRVNVLQPGEKKELIISGKIPGESGDLKEFKAEAGVERAGAFVLQNQAALVASVIEPLIEVKATLGDAPALHFGEPLTASILISNSSTLTLDRGTLEVIVSDTEDLIAWDTFKTDSSYRYEIVSGNSDGANGSRILRFTEFGILAPGDEFYITFTVSLIDVPTTRKTNDFYIELTADLRAESGEVTAPLEVNGETVRADVLRVGD